MKKLIIVAALLLTTLGHAQDWTRFRGPNGSGLSEAKTIPTSWTDADFNWKVELPGVGHSSPVVWGEKVFVTACDEDTGTFRVICVDANDGRILWQQENAFTPHRKHNLNSYASGTPALDSEHVYVSRAEADRITLSALTHDGKVVWGRDFGPFVGNHGGGKSPILHDGLVILPNEQRGVSFLVAVDARSGETRWRVPRTSDAGNYSTPCVYQPEQGDPAIIFNSEAHGISAIAPKTGAILWEFADAFDKRSVSSPVIAGNLILGSCGSGGGGNYVVAIRPGDPANATAPERAYEIRRSAPYVPTSIVVDDWLYLWSEGGVLSRVHALTGEVDWTERVGGNYYGSPVCVDGRLFCVSTTGEVVVVNAGEQFEVLARNPLKETTHSTPAIAGGRMYIHTSRHLISVGGSPTASENGT